MVTVAVMVNEQNNAPELIDLRFNKPERLLKPVSNLEVDILKKETEFVFNDICFKVIRNDYRTYTIEVKDRYIPDFSAGTILWDGNELHNQLLFSDKYFDLQVVGIDFNNLGKLLVTQL